MFPLKDNIPTDRFPVVTVALILANVAAYILAVRHGGSLISGPGLPTDVRYGAIPYELTHGGTLCGLIGHATTIRCDPHGLRDAVPFWATPLTGMFMHASILHIAGNMLFLWIFGNNVEDRMGRVRFVLFYLLGGLAALALQVLVQPDASAPTLGASGAVAAVLGGYLLLYPRARVLTVVFVILFFTVIELPAVLLLLVWFAQQALFAAARLTDPLGGGGVAYFAHVGGFVFGLLTIRLVTSRSATRSSALRVS